MQFTRDQAARKILTALSHSKELVNTRERSIVDLIARLFEVLDSRAPADGLTKEDDILLVLHIATLVKDVHPVWAEARFRDAYEAWADLLAGKTIHREGSNAYFAAIMDHLFSAVSDRFLSSSELQLFELANALVEWSVTAPRSADTLLAMQASVARLDDARLRSTLLAPIVRGWLSLGEPMRVMRLVQFADPDGLVHGHLYRDLGVCIPPVDDWVRSFVLEFLLRTPQHEFDDAFAEVLSAWLAVRGQEHEAESGQKGRCDFLGGLAEDWLTQA